MFLLAAFLVFFEKNPGYLPEIQARAAKLQSPQTLVNAFLALINATYPRIETLSVYPLEDIGLIYKAF
jgi:hypothetical protein